MSYCPEHGTKMAYAEAHEYSWGVIYECPANMDGNTYQEGTAEVWVYNGWFGSYVAHFPLVTDMHGLGCFHCEDGCLAIDTGAMGEPLCAKCNAWMTAFGGEP